MPKFDKTKAKSRIESIFKRYSTLTAGHFGHLNTVIDGKLYELYVLAQLLKELRSRGFRIALNGTSIRFKGAPGYISASDPHFDVFVKGRATPAFKIYTDVKVQTLGAHLTGTHGLSGNHEIDILVVPPSVTGQPGFGDVVLGVECKSQAKFTKDVVRGVLGMRRELCWWQGPFESKLSLLQKKKKVVVPANPPSEFWLAYADPAGSLYKDSPAAFGIEFKHWQP